MKVYLENAVDHTLMVTPGSQNRDVSDWQDANGNPKRFDIRFEKGAASVDEKMARYLVEAGLANRTPLKRVRNGLIGAFA
jgi:hypothetical protein